MITVGMQYHVLPGKGPTFEEKFGEVLTVLGAAAGHVRSQLFQDVNDRASYLIVSEWKTTDAFTDFLASDAFADAVSWARAGILDRRPVHQVYQHAAPLGPPH